jgi:hypothetical protein
MKPNRVRVLLAWIVPTLEALERHLPALRTANEKYDGVFLFGGYGQNGEVQVNVVCEPDEIVTTLEVEREVLKGIARKSMEGDLYDCDAAVKIVEALIHMLGVPVWEDEDEWLQNMEEKQGG